MVYIFFCCIVVKTLDLKAPLWLMQKNLPVFWANRNAAWKCTKIYGIYEYSTVSNYMNIVLFLTISKQDIYQPKSLGKSATNFYLNIWKPEKVANKYWNWLPTYLNYYVINIRLTNIRQQDYTVLTNRWKKFCIRISYRFFMHLQAAILFAQEIGNCFVLTAWNL
jgi:hypothetical protein